VAHPAAMDGGNANGLSGTILATRKLAPGGALDLPCPGSSAYRLQHPQHLLLEAFLGLADEVLLDFSDHRGARGGTQTIAQVSKKRRVRGQNQLVEAPVEARVLQMLRHMLGKPTRHRFGRPRPLFCFRSHPCIAVDVINRRRRPGRLKLIELAQPRHSARHCVDGCSIRISYDHPGSLHKRKNPHFKHVRLQPAQPETTIIGQQIGWGDLGQ